MNLEFFQPVVDLLIPVMVALRIDTLKLTEHVRFLQEIHHLPPSQLSSSSSSSSPSTTHHNTLKLTENLRIPQEFHCQISVFFICKVHHRHHYHHNQYNSTESHLDVEDKVIFGKFPFCIGDFLCKMSDVFLRQLKTDHFQ